MPRDFEHVNSLDKDDDIPPYLIKSRITPFRYTAFSFFVFSTLLNSSEESMPSANVSKNGEVQKRLSEGTAKGLLARGDGKKELEPILCYEDQPRKTKKGRQVTSAQLRRAARRERFFSS